MKDDKPVYRAVLVKDGKEYEATSENDMAFALWGAAMKMASEVEDGEAEETTFPVKKATRKRTTKASRNVPKGE